MHLLHTASRLALMTGAAFAMQTGALLAQDATFTNNADVDSYVIPPPQAPDTNTLINNGRIGPGGFAPSEVGGLVLSSGTGTGSIVIEHNGQAAPIGDGRLDGPAIIGRVDLSGISGGIEFNINDGALWRTAGESRFGAGDDALNIAEGGALSVGRQFGSSNSAATAEERNQFVQPLDTVIDFGGGFNMMDNAGVVLVGGRLTLNDPGVTFANHEAQLTLENLDEFHHSGLILLGGFRNELVDSGTDRWFDDILSMPGAHFIGEGGEIVFDIDINGVGQTACDGALRDPTTGDMPGGDCVAIVGGSTEGTTTVTINDIFGGDRGAYNPDGTVLVDVSGGTSAQGHFVLNPDSDFYSAPGGGVLDKGLFFYSLLYDEDNQQHKLVGLPGGNGLQLPLLAEAAHDLWRLSAGAGMDRQAGLRGGSEDGDGGWIRFTTEASDRDVAQSVSAYGADFTFDNTYAQSSYAVTGGLDILQGGDGDTRYVVGIMAGYGYTEVDFDASPNAATFDSWTGGAYASIVSGGFFLDALVSGGKGDMKLDMPALDLFPTGTILDTNLLSVGGEVEAGWRLPLGESAFVEPLASVSYVRTTYDDLVIPADDPSRVGLAAEFDDPTSLRAAVGARLSLDQDYGAAQVRYSLLGRVWNEFEGETTVSIRNAGPAATVIDEFTGTFTELGLGASLQGGGGAVSGFVNLGGKFGDDYQATTASGGVRLNW